MKFYTGLVLLFLFMLSSLFASLIDLIEKRNLRRKQSRIEIINVCCSILVFTYFFVPRNVFLGLSILVVLVIYINSIIIGIINDSFHIKHHIIRALIILLIFLLLY